MEEKEIKILNEIQKKSLVRRSEVVQLLDGNGNAADSIIQNLDSKGFVRIITPFGERCLALTQKGMKTLREV